MPLPLLPGRLRAALSCAALALLAARSPAQSNYAWSAGVSGDWNSAGWKLNGTPGVGPPAAADNAAITVGGVGGAAYAVTVRDARTVGNLTLNATDATLKFAAGGALTVNGTFQLSPAAVDTSGGTLTLNGAFNWYGGTVGSGGLTAGHGGTITSGTISGGTVTLAGPTPFNWTSNNIALSAGGTLAVAAGTTVAVTSNGGVSGAGTVTNAGTLDKTNSGTLLLQSGVTLANAGTLRAGGGDWSLEPGSVVNNTGTIDIAAGRQLHVNGGTLALNAGSSVTGPGLIVADDHAGGVAVNAAVNSAGGLNYVRGTLSGTGSLTLAGPFNFGLYDANSVTGVTINAAGGGAWGGGGTPRIGTGTVNLTGGTTTWGGAPLTFTDGGALTVAGGATLQLTDNSSVNVTNGSPTLAVNGTLTKSGGTSNSTLPAALTLTVGGTGLLDIESGTLILQAPTVNNGTLKVGPAASLNFNQPTSLAGGGAVAVSPGGTLTAGVGAGNTQAVSVGSLTNAGTVQATSGTLKIDAAVALSNYAAGTLTGGTWKATNAALNFDGRAISAIAAGTTVELSGSAASVSGLTALTQNAGQLRLAGGATLTPAGGTVTTTGPLEVGGGSTFGGPVTVGPGGTLAGRGTVNGAVAVQAGGLLAPGPGPYAAGGVGVLTAGSTAFAGGGRYAWEVNSWTAGAGSGFDQLKGQGGAKLNLAGASAGNPFTVAVASLNGSAPGQVPNFDANVARTFALADFSNGNATGGVQNFSADKFALDTSAFANDTAGGQFSLSVSADGNQLLLTFTPVPEPAGLLAGAALAGLGWLRFRGVSGASTTQGVRPRAFDPGRCPGLRNVRPSA